MTIMPTFRNILKRVIFLLLIATDVYTKEGETSPANRKIIIAFVIERVTKRRQRVETLISRGIRIIVPRKAFVPPTRGKKTDLILLKTNKCIVEEEHSGI